MVSIDNRRLIAIAAEVLKPVRVKGRLFGDVAAAVLSETGDVFTGVCVDTPGWGLCAERSAAAAMITAGQYGIRKIVAVWREESSGKLYVLPPCGICREFLRSISDSNLEAEVVLGEAQSATLQALLPFHDWPAAEIRQ